MEPFLPKLLLVIMVYYHSNGNPRRMSSQLALASISIVGLECLVCFWKVWKWTQNWIMLMWYLAQVTPICFGLDYGACCSSWTENSVFPRCYLTPSRLAQPSRFSHCVLSRLPETGTMKARSRTEALRLWLPTPKELRTFKWPWLICKYSQYNEGNGWWEMHHGLSHHYVHHTKGNPV